MNFYPKAISLFRMPRIPTLTTIEKAHSPKRHEYIDALRGLAIVGVLAVHSAQTVPPANELLRYSMLAGLRGVQLFYIASALTLCMSWIARSQHESTPIRNFLLRRLFRIAPLFLIAIPVYVFIYGFAPRYWAPNGVKNWFIPATALLLHGFHPETINGIVPGSWSVAVEATFYALFPFLIRHARTTVGLGTLLAIALTASLCNYVCITPAIASLYPTNQRYLVDAFACFNFLAQFPVFVVGMLLFHVIAREPTSRTTAFIVSGVIAIYLGIISFFPSRYAYAVLTEPLVAAPGLAVFSGLLGVFPTPLLVNPITTTLGKYSYGLYLFHWVIIEGFRQVGLVRYLEAGNLASVLFFVATTIAAAFVASLLYYVIEQPCIRLGSRVIRSVDISQGVGAVRRLE